MRAFHAGEIPEIMQAEIDDDDISGTPKSGISHMAIGQQQPTKHQIGHTGDKQKRICKGHIVPCHQVNMTLPIGKFRQPRQDEIKPEQHLPHAQRYGL